MVERGYEHEHRERVMQPDDDDDPAAGYDDALVDLESDYEYCGSNYEHVGSYDLANEHDQRVYRSVVGRPPGVNPVAVYDWEYHGTVVVVHRRSRGPAGRVR
jgi:hypothetical protein